jgi:hypothetical protein
MVWLKRIAGHAMPGPDLCRNTRPSAAKSLTIVKQVLPTRGCHVPVFPSEPRVDSRVRTGAKSVPLKIDGMGWESR